MLTRLIFEPVCFCIFVYIAITGAAQGAWAGLLDAWEDWQTMRGFFLSTENPSVRSALRVVHDRDKQPPE